MLLNLSDLSDEPLYSQIIRQIRAMILSGHLPPGDPLPSIRDLARTQKISVITVQKAYDDLARDGLLVARRGKGYFAAELAKADKALMTLDRLRAALAAPIASALAEGLDAKTLKRVADEVIDAASSGANAHKEPRAKDPHKRSY